MPYRTNPALSQKMRGYSRRLTARLHMNKFQRLNLQLDHSPIAVLGIEHRQA
ncbi:MAG: hypothetical protein QM658_17470 [Gordonia sp. (in: high G+C Gram-positive bacteria)]